MDKASSYLFQYIGTEENAKAKNGLMKQIIYLKMLLMSANKNGYIFYSGVYETLQEEIAEEINEKVKDVKETLEYLTLNNLIMVNEENDCHIFGASDMVGSETASTIRSRNSRNNKKLLQCNSNATTCNTEKEIEEDIEKEEIKSIEKDKKIDIIAPSVPEEPSTLEPAEITLKLNTGEEYPIYYKDIVQWQEIYPNVDVMQQLRNMKGWLISNPKKERPLKA